MIKTKDTPLWVFLAFSSIESPKGAKILIWACVAFTLYSLPWPLYFADALGELGNKIFFDDWYTFLMMIPITAWYVAALKWMNARDAWQPATPESGS